MATAEAKIADFGLSALCTTTRATIKAVPKAETTDRCAGIFSTRGSSEGNPGALRCYVLGPTTWSLWHVSVSAHHIACNLCNTGG